MTEAPPSEHSPEPSTGRRSRGKLLGPRRSWLRAQLVGLRSETRNARTLTFDVPGWPGHQAGQHLDVRLTAPDGYSAQRAYSISAPADGDRVSITVQTVGEGEVSPYLVDDMELGDELEVRGPIGGWFVWAPSPEAPVQQPILLVGGGSGVVPLMAMVRERARRGSRAPFRLVYSVRTADQVLYAEELAQRASEDGLQVELLYTRTAPEGSARPAGPDHRGRSGHPSCRGLERTRAASCLRLRPDGVRGARHRTAALPRLHQPHDPRRALRTLRSLT